MTERSIPFDDLERLYAEQADELRAAADRVLASGRYVFTQGKEVVGFERAFADYVGTADCVGLSSGTAALWLALEALGIGAGDEVIVPANTYVASVFAISYTGATPVLADVDEVTFTLDPAAVQAAITPRTAALMPVHLFGCPCDMDALGSIAAAAGLAIVEDAAQAHGAECGGRSVGTFGIGTFSLYGTKNITCGEGGLATTDDDDIARTLRLLRNQGMRARYDYEMPGYNWRLTDLQAAVAIPQVNRLKEITAARNANAASITAGLTGTPGLLLPGVPPGRSHVWHQYTVRIAPDAPVSREEFCTRLTRAGVGHGIYYPKLMHDYPCYRANPRVVLDHTPRARQMTAQVVSLPVHPGLDAMALAKVVDAAKEAIRG